MTFYRKYRPQTIEELDLESVRNSFKKFASNLDKLPHAYLFAGPRGTGKTSSARILAKLVNCEDLQKSSDEHLEPCNKCDQCNAINNGSSIDVIEMDAASNRGIDDIRSLRESVGLAPSFAKKKFYIIDEAHMLTTEAANAFLKTLEEPPEHVMFVLATTNPEKLPTTVKSRLHKVVFNRANSNDIKRQVERISKLEKLKITDEQIATIAKLADGSFRDAAKYLEDVAMGVDIDANLDQKIETLMQMFADRECSKLLDHIMKYSEEGNSAKQLLDDLIEHARQILRTLYGLAEAEDYGMSKADIINLLELMLDAKSQLKTSSESFVPLEILSAKWCEGVELTQKKTSKTKSEDTSAEVKKKKLKKSTEKIDLDEDSWSKILMQLREKNASIEALLRASKPLSLDGNTLSVGFYYRFHKERLDNNVIRKTLEDVCSDVLGLDPVKIVCTLTERDKPLPKQDDPPLQMIQEPNVIQAAKEVFG